MSVWFNKVRDDLSHIPDCISHFEDELADARKDLAISSNKTVERHSAELPGVIGHRHTQLQEIEAILEYLNIQLRKTRAGVFKKFLENYQRQLSSRDCEKYTDGDPDVVALTEIVNEFALLRNSYISLFKGLEQKGWMISHIVKLRAAGLEDIKIH